uniref:Scaffold protein Nfu/NifU N-terminal domain-containing protein n=1 Tax=Neobodo designis TaxID=312471 RepID=A0A7S1W621_NEODS|mmetsp:Transcript_53690/g.165168  ORF Transcript_53690/g.165168 Transcript_53690/m.165168 type:complete len:332 (+) Transcript_53690:43-1038(+)
MRRVFGGLSARHCAAPSASPLVVAALRNIFVQCRDTPNDDCMMFFAPGYEFLKPREGESVAVTMTVEKENKHISPLAKRLFRIYGVDEVTIGHRFVTVTRQTEPDLGEDDGDEAESMDDIRGRISLTNASDIEKGKGFVPSPDKAKESATPPQMAPPSSKATPSPAGGGMQVKQHVLPDEEIAPWQPPEWFDLQCQVCAAIADHAHSKEPTVELDAPHPHQDTQPAEGDCEVVLSIKELIATVIRPEIQKDGGDIRYLQWEKASGEMLVELLGACKTCKSSTTTLADLIERTTRHWIPEVTSVVEANQRRKLQQQQQQQQQSAQEGAEAAA